MLFTKPKSEAGLNLGLRRLERRGGFYLVELSFLSLYLLIRSRTNICRLVDNQ